MSPIAKSDAQPSAAEQEPAPRASEHPADAQPSAAEQEPRFQSAFTEVPAPSSFADLPRNYEYDELLWRSRMASRQQRVMTTLTFIGGAAIILGIGALALIIAQSSVKSKTV